MLAYAGPGYLVSVGYMDPGNWATDLAGGAKFGYALLSVIMLSNLMAILMQSLCVRLGVATGRDLAQACRDFFSPRVSFCLWVLCEIAIAACDLAELLGSAIALQLLFGIPLAWGVCITALDVIVLLLLLNKGFRYTEALVILLVATVGICFIAEILFSRPDLGGILLGYVPKIEILQNPEMLYIAIGILGATVMPHNLYLHSSIVQTRDWQPTTEKKWEAIKFGTIDSTVALFFALFINSAILIVSNEAIANFNQVVQLNPRFYEGFCLRGLAKSQLRDFQAAIADFNQALRLNPNHTDAYNGRGISYVELGDIQKAVADFNQTIKINPTSPDGYYKLGVANFRGGNHQQAIAHFNQALKIDPNLADAYGSRGLARYALGDNKRAVADLQQAAKLFLEQGNIPAYQQTQAVIQQVQR
ncbi:Nramp family divalent metal transporter [Fischerella sp.]|uniref:Nramp family divalent metal transporter n=1 Tax=Fischerella sp. TaxID=1191 RepID=UPI0025BAC4FD|nr:Nramp family divalent metal transporter [Fischerella sp.]